MSDEELIKRLDEIERKVELIPRRSTNFTTLMVLVIFFVLLLHGCDFK